jgi:hypothetical protein
MVQPEATARGGGAGAEGRIGGQQADVSEEPLKHAIKQAQALIDSISKEARSTARRSNSSTHNASEGGGAASSQGDGAAPSTKVAPVSITQQTVAEPVKGIQVRG